MLYIVTSKNTIESESDHRNPGISMTTLSNRTASNRCVSAETKRTRIKVHLHCTKANVKTFFSIIFVAVQCEQKNLIFSMNPSGSNVSFAFAMIHN